MANVNDVATVIASALGEISVTGTLDVVMDGSELIEAVGRPTGDDLEVIVLVRRSGADVPANPRADY